MEVRITTNDGELTGKVLEYEIKILSSTVELDKVKSYGLESVPGQVSQYMLRLTNGTTLIDHQGLNNKRMTGFFLLAVPGIRDPVRIEIVGSLRSLHVLPDSEANTFSPMSDQKAMAVLGVNASSSREEIESAYSKRTEEYSPEHVRGLAEKFRVLAQVETRRISQARTLLLQRLKSGASQ